MSRFKKGEPVWLYWTTEHGYPQMYHRPAMILKRIHPTCYRVALVETKPRERDRIEPSQWKLDRYQHNQHPSDMIPYANDPGAHLRALRDRWQAESDPGKIAAHEKQEAERKRMNDTLNRTLRPILARMFA